MATQRYISTSFWDDPWVHSISPTDKLVYLHLLTNTLTNIAGVYKLSIDRIAYDTGLKPANIKETLNTFIEHKKTFIFDEYIILPNWPKHQKWDGKPKIYAGIMAVLKELPDNLILFLNSINYTFPVDKIITERELVIPDKTEIPNDKVSIPYPYGTNYSDSDSDRDIDINIKKNIKKSDGEESGESNPSSDDSFPLSESFTIFWQHYPRKVSKTAAEKAWAKIKLTPALFETIIRALEAQKQYTWANKDPTYVPHPATWLNGKRWNDEVTPYRSRSPSQSSPLGGHGRQQSVPLDVTTAKINLDEEETNEEPKPST